MCLIQNFHILIFQHQFISLGKYCHRNKNLNLGFLHHRFGLQLCLIKSACSFLRLYVCSVEISESICRGWGMTWKNCMFSKLAGSPFLVPRMSLDLRRNLKIHSRTSIRTYVRPFRSYSLDRSIDLNDHQRFLMENFWPPKWPKFGLFCPK